MKKQPLTVASIKAKIDEMVGKEVTMQVCRGRKQIKRYKGTLEKTFSRVFTVRIDEHDGAEPTKTYSYSDILCGEVQVAEK